MWLYIPIREIFAYKVVQHAKRLLQLLNKHGSAFQFESLTGIEMEKKTTHKNIFSLNSTFYGNSNSREHQKHDVSDYVIMYTG